MSENDIAVKVENISKRYRIGSKEREYDTFGAAILGALKSPLVNYRKYRSLYKFNDKSEEGSNEAPGSEDVIWPLRNVSFEVKRGEALGIIGANGAGKSTLLKILARITTPTSGHAEIRGKVSSLLEVGTGFHQELTGRENIYLNSVVLGMTKKEVEKRFDEIVDFSGVEKFLDTPVKRYSSGMRVRLAFAVAAHLEPEVLIIDEVLAVGDADFQKKCIGKMGSVTQEGRTVLFVSHNMGAVAQLCGRAIWLKNGRVNLCGDSVDIVGSYLSEGSVGHATWRCLSSESRNIDVQLNTARLLSVHNQPTTLVNYGDSFFVEIAYSIVVPTRNLSIVFRVSDSEGNYVFETFDSDTASSRGHVREVGEYISKCTVPPHLLKPGRYHLSAMSLVYGKRKFELFENILTFDISEVGYILTPQRLGAIAPILEWNIQKGSALDQAV